METKRLVIGPPDMTGAPLPVYANITHASFTPYDFRLTFSLLSTPHDRSERDPLAPSAPPRPVVEVVVPVGAVRSLLDVVGLEYDDFVKRFGAPQPHLAQAAGDGVASRVR